MDEFRVVTTDISGVEQELVPNFLRLRGLLTSPVQGLTVRAPVRQRPWETLRVRVMRNTVQIFGGRVDEQRFSLSQDGMTLELQARTHAATLLDNQALPRMFENISTQALFNAYIAPHGFVLVAAQRTLPEFTVRTGQTIWDAFATFTRRTYDRVPIVVGDMVIVSDTNPGEPTIIGTAQRPISRLEHIISHYRPISRVFIRDEAGEYSTSVENPDATPRQIMRERFIVPGGEFVAQPRWDAITRIRRSMREMERLSVQLPGFVNVWPGGGVIVQHPSVHIANMIVDENVFTLDERGARTQLTLANMMYD